MDVKDQFENHLDNKISEKLPIFSIFPTPQTINEHPLIVQMSYNCSIIVLYFIDKKVKIWKQVIQSIQINFIVYGMAISQNNKYLACAGDVNINLYNLQKKSKVWEFKHCYNYSPYCIFSQDSKYLLYCRESQLFLKTVVEYKQICQFKTDQEMKSIIISQDNRFLSCITSLDSIIYIWDLQKKCKLIQKETNQSWGMSLSSSADSSTFISSSNGLKGLIQIWKLVEFKGQYQLTLTKNIRVMDDINCVILTSDEQYLISCYRYSEKIVIHQRQSGILIQVLNSGVKGCYSQHISVSKDMNTMVTCFGHKVQIWKRMTQYQIIQTQVL